MLLEEKSRAKISKRIIATKTWINNKDKKDFNQELNKIEVCAICCTIDIDFYQSCSVEVLGAAKIKAMLLLIWKMEYGHLLSEVPFLKLFK